MRRALALLASLLTLTGAAFISAAPASANTLDTYTLSSSTVVPGSTVTASMSWTVGGPDFDVARVLGFALPSQLSASWTTASSTPSVPCATNVPPLATCQFSPPFVVGQTLSMTATFAIAADATPGSYTIRAASDFGGDTEPQGLTLTVLSDATPAISVSPTSTDPGSTATATAPFTALTTGDIRVGVNLFGTGGNGTLGTATNTTGLDGCVIDGTNTSFRCTWTGAVVGQTRTIVIPINVGSSATAGESWTVAATSNSNSAAARSDTTQLSIVQAGPPTPTASPTPTPSASTSDTAVPTAVPAGEGPLVGGGSSAPVLLAVVAVFLVGLGAVVVTRRTGRRQA